VLHIPAVVDSDTLNKIRYLIDSGAWSDGRATAGHQSIHVKRNTQLPEDSDEGRRAGNLIISALDANASFISAALPSKIVPPLFNRYGVGDTYGPHIDGSIRPVGPGQRVRTDLSATLFLTPPADYDGGELVVNGDSGTYSAKFEAGDLLLYPASTIHHVKPVTRGSRISAFFWVQSIVRDTTQRKMLFDLDCTIQRLTAAHAVNEAILSLTGHYHNLIRLWADV
jgi:PKHD-type hydroxylase